MAEKDRSIDAPNAASHKDPSAAVVDAARDAYQPKVKPDAPKVKPDTSATKSPPTETTPATDAKTAPTPGQDTTAINFAAPIYPSQKDLQAAVTDIANELRKINPSASALATILEGKTFQERQQLEASFPNVPGQSLDSRIDQAFALQVTEFSASGDPAAGDRLKYLLHRPDQPSASADKLDLMLYDAKHGSAGNVELEQRIRDTVRVMSPATIKAELAHSGLSERLLAKDNGLSDKTREVLEIYLNGARDVSGARLPDDTRRLAGIALKSGDRDLFKEVMGDASPGGRQAFRDQGPMPSDDPAFNLDSKHHFDAEKRLRGQPIMPDSEALLLNKFGNSPDIFDAMNDGRVSTASMVSQDIGLFSRNLNSMDTAIRNMPEEQRQSYIIGRQLSSGQTATELGLDDATAKSNLAFYERLHGVMENTRGVFNVGGSKEARIARLEEPILYPNSTLFQEISPLTGTFTGGSADGIEQRLRSLTSPEHKAELAYLKDTPDGQPSAYRTQVDTVLSAALSKADAARLKALVAEIAKPGDVNPDVSKKPFLDRLDSARTAADKLRVLSSMTPEEIARYQRGKDANNPTGNPFVIALPDDSTPQSAADRNFRSEIDRTINDMGDIMTMRSTSDRDAFEAATSIRAGLDREVPDPEVVRATLGGTGSTTREIIENLEKELSNPDSTLRKKLGDLTHPEIRRQFELNLHAQLNPQDYKKFVTPLVAGVNELPLAERVGLYSPSDKGQMFTDFLKRKDTDRAELTRALTVDGAQSDLGIALRASLSENERVLLANELRDVAKNGSVAPAELVRENVLNITPDATALRQMIEGLTPGQKQSLKDSYSSDYGHEAAVDLQKKAGNDRNLTEVIDMLGDRFNNDESSYQRMLGAVQNSFSGDFSRFFMSHFGDGTSVIAGQAKNDFAAKMAEASHFAGTLSPTDRAKYEDNLRVALTDYAASKQQDADQVIDVGIAAGSIGAAIFTGGLSFTAMTGLATAEGFGGALIKKSIVGNDYQPSQFSTDVVSFGTSAFFDTIGPANYASVFRYGRAAGEELAASVMRDATPALASKIAAHGSSDFVTAVADKITAAAVSGKSNLTPADLTALARTLGVSDAEAPGMVDSLKSLVQPQLDAASARFVSRVPMIAASAGTSGFLGTAITDTYAGKGPGTTLADSLQSGLIAAGFGTLFGTTLSTYGAVRKTYIADHPLAFTTDASSFLPASVESLAPLSHRAPGFAESAVPDNHKRSLQRPFFIALDKKLNANLNLGSKIQPRRELIGWW